MDSKVNIAFLIIIRKISYFTSSSELKVTT